MTNNDLLIRLRYALDMKNVDLVDIFALGGVRVTKEDVLNMLVKVKDDEPAPEHYYKVNNKLLEAFLNGFITWKRGKREGDAGPLPVTGEEHANNMLLKKVKIALALTAEEVLDLLYEGGVSVSKGELGAILRAPGHKNYKICMDRFARCFLKGLTLKYRGE